MVMADERHKRVEMVGGEKSLCCPTSTRMNELVIPWHVMIKSSSVVGLVVYTECCCVVCVGRFNVSRQTTGHLGSGGTERRLLNAWRHPW